MIYFGEFINLLAWDTRLESVYCEEPIFEILKNLLIEFLNALTVLHYVLRVSMKRLMILLLYFFINIYFVCF